ncbi:histone-lysine n-methyltransferase [Moniliophthora roreri MCA 2997]|uniref:Histone-lysine N-methyltransferase, H3 lysine-79 specific n=2 Tax=Moniliophthora roreri TaxID=221103 RepID=V2XSF5_MONRO|nr:histone-lysine n-methyltransferase [Moniliophthora roreri MCA 2997]KAI3615535.1 histone-lysine n-methyltransferase [Moniliophthora roreri]
MPTDQSFFSGKPSTAPSTIRVRTVVTTKKKLPRHPSSSPPKPVFSSPPNTSPLTSPEPSPAPKKKRKSQSDQEVGVRVKKKTKITTTAKKKSRSSSYYSASDDDYNPDIEGPCPPQIYRSSASTSRSTSSIPTTRRMWSITGKGEPGPGHVSSEQVVCRLMKSYKAYFRNPDDSTDKRFEPHPTNYPVCELEYPNTDSIERFVLLQPKDKDHYSPIMDFERSLYTIVKYYMTPAQQALFGPIPGENSFLNDDNGDRPPTSEEPPSSVSPSPPHSRASTSSSMSSLTSVSSSNTSDEDDSESLSSLSSLSDSEEDTPHKPPSKPREKDREKGPSMEPEPEEPTPTPNLTLNPNSTAERETPLLRLLQRSIHTCNGPLFLDTVERINQLIKSLKYPTLPPVPSFDDPDPTNALMANLQSLVLRQPRIPEKLLMRVIEENYQRSVGPHVAKLRSYEAFSSTVYGELMPSLVSSILSTHCPSLGPDSLFLDLGSGVGNICVQASLQTGCKSYGIEILPNPSNVGKEMVEAWKTRCQFWGLSCGEIELEEGDFLKSAKVDELMGKADIVLVDNKVFDESLNEALRPKFLDLKEGAVVISLAPFSQCVNARVTERNIDDISAIFSTSSHAYYPGSVSWGNGGGVYYVHKVDREGYNEVRERYLRLGGDRGGRERRWSYKGRGGA